MNAAWSCVESPQVTCVTLAGCKFKFLTHGVYTYMLRLQRLQDLARAVHALYTQQLVAALPEALEAAMRAASDHACQAAAAACGALLPADVPPAAAGTAAALVTASCKASCAQRLLQEVRLHGISWAS